MFADWHFYFRILHGAEFRLVVLTTPENAFTDRHVGCTPPTPVQPQVLSPHLETKAAIVLRTEKLSRARREVVGEPKGERAPPDSVCLRSDHPALLCEISDDIKRCFIFRWSDDRRGKGVILIEAQSRYSQPGPVKGLAEGTTTGRAKKIFPAHSSRLLESMLLPSLTVAVTASMSSSSNLCYLLATHILYFLLLFFETTPIFVIKITTTTDFPIRKMKF